MVVSVAIVWLVVIAFAVMVASAGALLVVVSACNDKINELVIECCDLRSRLGELLQKADDLGRSLEIAKADASVAEQLAERRLRRLEVAGQATDDLVAVWWASAFDGQVANGP